MIQEAHAFIRQWLTQNVGAEFAKSIRIQYGGGSESSTKEPQEASDRTLLPKSEQSGKPPVPKSDKVGHLVAIKKANKSNTFEKDVLKRALREEALATQQNKSRGNEVDNAGYEYDDEASQATR